MATPGCRRGVRERGSSATRLNTKGENGPREHTAPGQRKAKRRHSPP
ncbi:hypothetical protein AH4AK4_2662 [Aeromonas hydrophila 4AK4]|nr:hypothetical protein AH4AK4_2662 [Aeromonas hydrophila 4AK4]